MVFAFDGDVLCDNKAGTCLSNAERDFLICECENRFDSENDGIWEENITVERCTERLLEVCGNELTTVDKACENKPRMQVCYDFAFYSMPCFTKVNYSQTQRDEAQEGKWNEYAKEVVSCCYTLYWEDEYYGDNNKTELYQESYECMKEDGATCESCALSISADDPVDGNDENNDAAENSSTDSDNNSEKSSSGCSISLI